MACRRSTGRRRKIHGMEVLLRRHSRIIQASVRRSSVKLCLKVPRGRVALKGRVLRSSLLAPHRFLGCRARRLVSSDVAVPGHPSQREPEAAAFRFEGA